MNSSINEKVLQETIDHENEYWSKVFDEEKHRKDHNLYTSYWWEDYYMQIISIVRVRIKRGTTVLELGSGSGKASLLLGNRYKKHLMDVSPQALQFAKHIANRLRAKHVEFMQGNGFDTRLQSKKYDFVWNIGVVEHYSRRQATAFVAEMVRLTKDGGSVAIAVPNFRSFHIWKARALNNPIFKYIRGYRLDSENDYTEADIRSFIDKACKKGGRKVVSVEGFRIGNPLPMGSPELVVKTIGRPLNALLIQRRFLIMVIVKLES